MTRKLASVQTIDSITPIEGADSIEVATVNGWKVVVRKNEFQEGDFVVFFEIDSWVPTEIAPFLTKDGVMPKEYNGVKGERLKTIKLRGQISQGLVIPFESVRCNQLGGSKELFGVDDDLTERLGVQKWERPESGATLGGSTKGTFPSYVRKTDQERIQNLSKYVPYMLDTKFEVSIKLDGSSMTIFSNQCFDEHGVCSRNNQVMMEGESLSTFANVAIRDGILEKLRNYCSDNNSSLALQGELMGPGIQKNREKLERHEFFLFDIYDIDSGTYLDPYDRAIIAEQLGIKHVPVLGISTLRELGFKNVDDILDYAEGKSINSPIREGLVFKADDGSSSFKVISNKFLLKGGD